MKNFLLGCILCLLVMPFASCDKDDEQMEYSSIYFPLATWADGNGVFKATFDYSRDTTFIIGAYCAGSVLPPQDIQVEIALATDSLAKAAASKPAIAAYTLLPESGYTVAPADMKVTIKKGTERGDMLVTFHTSTLDPAKSYILPLRITSVSAYKAGEKFQYLFFGITKK